MWLWNRAVTGRRLPVAWQAPAFSLAVWRPWRSIGVGAALAVTFMIVAAPSESAANIVELYGVVALALAMTAGAVGGDRRVDRHCFLFQNPGSFSGHYARTLALGYLAMMVVVAVVWLATGVAGHGLTLSWLAGTSVFATSVYAFGCLATAVWRRGDGALVVAWTLAPVALAVALEGPAHESLRVALEWPFVPLNAAFALQRSLAGGDWSGWHSRWAAQLVTFPATCVALTTMRLRALDRVGFR